MRIIITGSSSGIGRQLAEALVFSGHVVWGWARSDQEDWCTLLKGKGSLVRATRVDVREWTQVEAAAAHVAKAWNGVDALIACAGTQGAIGHAMACDPLAWGETVSTNLLGTYYPIRALFDLLLAPKPGRGKVIVFSGGGATKARPYFSAYGVSKTAVVRLAETLANEWEKLPIDINAVAPGAIYTAMTEEAIRLGSGVVGIAEYESALRLRQQGTTAVKTVELVNFLLSPQSDHLSGKLISAPWDPWPEFAGYGEALTKDDIYTLRRTVSKGKT